MTMRWVFSSSVALAVFGSLLGCGGAQSASSPQADFSAEGRACDRAVADASDAWRLYAVEMRVASIRAYGEGTSAYETAATRYLANAQSDRPSRGAQLAIARQRAARQAAGEAAGAAERAEIALEDAIDDSYDHRVMLDRYGPVSRIAAQAWNEAREATERTRRAAGASSDDEADIIAGAEAAPARAAELLERAERAEEIAEQMASSRSAEMEADRSSDRFATATDLTGGARTSCAL